MEKEGKRKSKFEIVFAHATFDKKLSKRRIANANFIFSFVLYDMSLT